MGMTDTNLCINCPTKKQETLFHHLIECPKYNYLKSKFIYNINTIAKLKNTSPTNLLQILMNNNKTCINMSIYLQ